MITKALERAADRRNWAIALEGIAFGAWWHLVEQLTKDDEPFTVHVDTWPGDATSVDWYHEESDTLMYVCPCARKGKTGVVVCMAGKRFNPPGQKRDEWFYTDVEKALKKIRRERAKWMT